jgi:hypothetical protein
MSKKSKFLLLLGVCCGTMLLSYADRGYSKKARTKASMNIETRNGFKNNLSLNLNSGLQYKGSIISNTRAGNPFVSSNLITYQKGNTIYIMPACQKIFVATQGAKDPGVKITIGSK